MACCPYVTSNGNACIAQKLFNGTKYCKKHWGLASVQKELGLAPPPPSSRTLPQVAAAAVQPVKSDPTFKLSDIQVTAAKSPEPVKPKAKFVDDVEDLSDVPSVDSMADGEDLGGLFDELESIHSEDFGEGGDGVRPTKKRNKPEGSQYSEMLVKLGYFSLLSVAESMSDPHLDGLVKDCIADKTINQCLSELAQEYEELLSLNQMDPHLKLLAATGVIALNKYTMSSLRLEAKKDEPSAAVSVADGNKVSAAAAGDLDFALPMDD